MIHGGKYDAYFNHASSVLLFPIDILFYDVTEFVNTFTPWMDRLVSLPLT